MQLFQCSAVLRLHRALRHAQDGGDFGRAELFKVFENQDLLLALLKLGHRAAKPLGQFTFDRRTTRARLRRDDPLGKFHGREVIELQRLFAQHTTLLRCHVPPV